jgi:protein-disulfide isomerase
MMPNNPKLTRNEQREAARAKAREMRLAQKRQAARKRVILIASIIAAAAIAVTSVVLTINNEVNNPVPTAVTPANMNFDGGIKIGKDLKVITDPTVQADTPNIIIYEDLQCPNCRDFDLPNTAQMREWVSSGKYTVQVHPISFLDGASPNEYSSRAASAAICVANGAPDKFFDYNTALFSSQPEEGSMGPSNNELATRAEMVGIENKPVLDCIKNSTYQSYVLSYTKDTVFKRNIPGTSLKVDGTPYIVLNGERFVGDFTNPALFAQWVLSTSAK